MTTPKIIAIRMRSSIDLAGPSLRVIRSEVANMMVVKWLPTSGKCDFLFDFRRRSKHTPDSRLPIRRHPFKYRNSSSLCCWYGTLSSFAIITTYVYDFLCSAKGSNPCFILFAIVLNTFYVMLFDKRIIDIFWSFLLSFSDFRTRVLLLPGFLTIQKLASSFRSCNTQQQLFLIRRPCLFKIVNSIAQRNTCYG